MEISEVLNGVISLIISVAVLAVLIRSSLGGEFTAITNLISTIAQEIIVFLGLVFIVLTVWAVLHPERD